MKSSEILITARALINTPERWVKGRKPGCWCAVDAIIVATYYARPHQERALQPLLGIELKVPDTWEAMALMRAMPSLPASVACNAALEALKCAIGNGHEIVSWNDAPERTHAEVMAAFDRAIAAEQAKEPQ